MNASCLAAISKQGGSGASRPWVERRAGPFFIGWHFGDPALAVVTSGPTQLSWLVPFCTEMSRRWQHHDGTKVDFTGMKQAHCKSCWQEIPARISLYPRCGQLDAARVNKAVARLLVYVAAGLLAVGLALWSTFHGV